MRAGLKEPKEGTQENLAQGLREGGESDSPNWGVAENLGTLLSKDSDTVVAEKTSQFLGAKGGVDMKMEPSEGTTI